MELQHFLVFSCDNMCVLQVEGRHQQQGVLGAGCGRCVRLLAAARFWHHKPQRCAEASASLRWLLLSLVIVALDNVFRAWCNVTLILCGVAFVFSDQSWMRTCVVRRWVKGALDEAPDVLAKSGTAANSSSVLASAPTVAALAGLQPLTCLDRHRASLAANTVRHCQGKQGASHALLFGPSGTGKSWLAWDSTLAAGACLCCCGASLRLCAGWEQHPGGRCVCC